MLDQYGFVVIHLNRYPEECQLCGETAWLTHCVPYYEEPCPEHEIGDEHPRGGTVGGMTCCKACHDGIYADHIFGGRSP